MNIVIIDGQGGQLGAQLVKEILTQFPDVTLTAIGTNAAATTSMIKAGAKNAATGENPVTVIYNTETFSERLLVISDWTFNVNAGFFVDYFQEITFINPFLCENSFEKIKMDNYDYVIVMFSTDNFNNHSLSSVNGMLE